MELTERDRLYNARALVPDFADFFERFAADSEAARARLASLRDLAFGPHPDERLDLFPAQRGAPLAAFFHGGYWRQFGKDDFSYVAQGLVPHGIAVAVVNYSLAPEATLRTIVAQACRSLAWLRANAARYGYDSDRIVAYGHSAGGHLAAMGAVEMPLRALAALSGLFDLEPLRETYINEWLKLEEAEARALSPLRFAPARALPLYLIYGGRDPLGFGDQARAFDTAWRAQGCSTTLEVAPVDHHFSLCARLIDPDDAINRRIAALVQES